MHARGALRALYATAVATRRKGPLLVTTALVAQSRLLRYIPAAPKSRPMAFPFGSNNRERERERREHLQQFLNKRPDICEFIFPNGRARLACDYDPQALRNKKPWQALPRNRHGTWPTRTMRPARARAAQRLRHGRRIPSRLRLGVAAGAAPIIAAAGRGGAAVSKRCWRGVVKPLCRPKCSP